MSKSAKSRSNKRTRALSEELDVYVQYVVMGKQGDEEEEEEEEKEDCSTY